MISSPSIQHATQHDSRRVLKPFKVQLKDAGVQRDFPNDHIWSIGWRESLPFVWNPRGLLVHRPRWVHTVIWDGKPHHMAVGYLCGNQTTVDCEFFGVVRDGRYVCARCEGVALASGLLSSSEISGRHVCVGGVRAVRECGAGCPERGKVEGN